MKQCLICGHVAEADDEKTCCKCGEASWRRLAPLEPAVTETLQEVQLDTTRRRGRPRKEGN